MARVCDRWSEWGGGVSGSGPRSEDRGAGRISRFRGENLSELSSSVATRSRAGRGSGCRAGQDAPWQPSLRTGGWWKVEAVWRVVVETDERAARNNQSGRQTTALDCDCANCDCSYPLDFSGYAHRRSVRHSGPNFSKARKILHPVRGGWALCRDTRPDRPEVWALARQRREREGREHTDQQNERRRVIVDAGGGRASGHGASVARGARALKGCGFNARRRRASSTAVRAAGARMTPPKRPPRARGCRRRGSGPPSPSRRRSARARARARSRASRINSRNPRDPSPRPRRPSTCPRPRSTRPPPPSPPPPPHPRIPRVAFRGRHPRHRQARVTIRSARGRRANPASTVGAPPRRAAPRRRHPSERPRPPKPRRQGGRVAVRAERRGQGRVAVRAGGAANPFGEATASRAKPKLAEEDTRSAWEKLPKPAMAQVVIVLSFTTIISLMLATFWVVVQVRPRRVFAIRTL